MKETIDVLENKLIYKTPKVYVHTLGTRSVLCASVDYNPETDPVTEEC